MRLKAKPTDPAVAFPTLRAALEPAWQEYLAAYRSALQRELDHVTGLMEAGLMDASAAAPYPSSTGMGAWEFRSAERLYYYVRSMFVPSPVAHRYANSNYEADVKVVRPDASAFLDAKAVSEAKHSFDSYVCKLAGKIGETVVSASLIGSLWSHSTLRITTASGPQTWTTQCIFKHSCLGKPHNQWPTRRVS